MLSVLLNLPAMMGFRVAIYNSEASEQYYTPINDPLQNINEIVKVEAPEILDENTLDRTGSICTVIDDKNIFKLHKHAATEDTFSIINRIAYFSYFFPETYICHRIDKKDFSANHSYLAVKAGQKFFMPVFPGGYIVRIWNEANRIFLAKATINKDRNLIINKELQGNEIGISSLENAYFDIPDPLKVLIFKEFKKIDLESYKTFFNSPDRDWFDIHKEVYFEDATLIPFKKNYKIPEASEEIILPSPTSNSAVESASTKPAVSDKKRGTAKKSVSTDKPPKSNKWVFLVVPILIVVFIAALLVASKRK